MKKDGAMEVVMSQQLEELQEKIEYHFTDEATLQKYRDHNKLVECRAYQTIYGIWYYYTVKDDQIDLSKYSYLQSALNAFFH